MRCQLWLDGIYVAGYSFDTFNNLISISYHQAVVYSIHGNFSASSILGKKQLLLLPQPNMGQGVFKSDTSNNDCWQIKN